MPNEFWFSLVPPVVAIVLAIWTKQVIPSLLIALWAGSLILTQSLFASVGQTVDYVIGVLSDTGNLNVLLFLYIFSGLVALIQLSGGVQAFTGLADKYINNTKRTLWSLWGLLPITFIDCGFRVVAAGSIIKPLAKKYSVSRERLAYMLNNSASPVIILIPFATTFVGYVIGVVNKGMQAAGVGGSAFQLFVRSIPFQFFSYTSIIIALISVIPALNLGSMKDLMNKSREKKGMQHQPAHGVEFAEEFQDTAKAETTEDQIGTATNAHKNEMSDDHESKMSKKHGRSNDHDEDKSNEMSMEHNHDMGGDPVLQPRITNLILPILILIPLSFYLMWGNNNPSRSMLIALFVTAVATAVLYLFQGMKLKKMMDSFIEGGNKLITTIAILVVAWPISNVSQDLGLTKLIQSTLGGFVSPGWIPVLAFAVTGAVAYFIGSSWGSWALMMPIAIPLAATTGSSLPIAIAAVFSGGTFGDVTSPVSGMTAMSAGIAEADHMKYVKAMTPYNITAAVVAAALFALVPFVI